MAKLKSVSTSLIDAYTATNEEEGESRGDKIDAIAAEIAEAIGESADDYQPDGGDDDDGDEHLAKLRHFVRRLIDDYTSARENKVES
jgi:erythromycin esterase-like protein